MGKGPQLNKGPYLELLAEGQGLPNLHRVLRNVQRQLYPRDLQKRTGICMIVDQDENGTFSYEVTANEKT